MNSRVHSIKMQNEEGEEFLWYGITVVSGNELLLQIDDLSEEEVSVLELSDAINALQPEAVHLADIIDDFLNRE